MDDTGYLLPRIGTIVTPYDRMEDIPRQSSLAADVLGRAEVFQEYAPGLLTLEECSKVWLIFLFDLAKPVELTTTSREDGRMRGIFATRSPRRPSRLGMSAVEVVSVSEGVVVFQGVDMRNGSPLLDIKPCFEC